MRTAMRKGLTESKLEEKAQVLSERTQRADYLVEKWRKRPGIGEGLDEAFDLHPTKVRNLAIVLENQENYLRNLTETVISGAFSTTPENVMRVIRLGYPNSTRGDIFLEWAMETSRDSIYYLSPVYSATTRGATAADVTHESTSYRFASEIEEEGVTGTINGANQDFTGATAGDVSNPPLRPFTVKILLDDVIIVTDDGSGNLVGAALEIGGANANTIDYTTGAIEFSLDTAPATGQVLTIVYNYDSEDATQYADLGEVELQLTDHQFRAKPWPLGVSWSKMTELLLGTTLDIDAEEALIRGAADEVKKSLDFHACRLGYRRALANTSVSFNTDFAQAGSDSQIAHAQDVTRTIDAAGDTIYNSLNRGGITKIYGAPNAVNFLKLHRRFTEDSSQPPVGVYKIGSLDGIDVFKAPTAIVPTGELVGVWKNPNVPEDVSIAFGTLIPLYQTQTLEFKNMYKETGLAHFGDEKTLQSAYLVRIQLTNL